MWQVSYDNKPTLYLVPTPIGNLEDITLRALNILKEVEVIFSEDTRETSLLLSHYGIKKKLICLEDHNENIVKNKVLKYLNDGHCIAIVTDRGTPIISDPGYKTVKLIVDSGYNVVSLPGATAFVPALTVSTIEPLPFLFYGFLNSKENKRKKELEVLSKIPYTIIFYEAPHRIKNTLDNMLEIFGNRNISVSREISKKFESIYRGNLEKIVTDIDNIKGEIVIVVSGFSNNSNNIDFISLVDKYITDGFSVSSAIKKVSEDYAINKNDLYNKYHGGRK